jgi:hypothetical protein
MRGSTGVPLRLTGRTRGLVPICRRQGGQLNGDMRFDWRAEGLACEIAIPVKSLGSGSSVGLGGRETDWPPSQHKEA